MARPLRLELPGAAYHLTALGNGGQPVFRGAEDSLLFLEILGESCTRFDWRCFGYCLLPDRYHLVVETRQPRSEEHTSELQSLMRNSYAVFCLKKKKKRQHQTNLIQKHTNDTTQSIQRLDMNKTI